MDNNKENTHYTLLWESTFQGMYLEVLERAGERSLQSDRSIIHSRYQPSHPELLIQPYQQQMVAALALLPEPQKKVLALGLGGGRQVTYIHNHFPSTHIDVVECSADIIEVAHRYFNLPDDERITIYHQDASNLSHLSSIDYDLILLDLCDSSGPIPYFQDIPYLRILKTLVNKNGWVVANTWSEGEILQKELIKWKKIFPYIYLMDSDGSEAVLYAGFQEVDIQLSANVSLPQNLALHLLDLQLK